MRPAPRVGCAGIYGGRKANATGWPPLSRTGSRTAYFSASQPQGFLAPSDVDAGDDSLPDSVSADDYPWPLPNDDPWNQVVFPPMSLFTTLSRVTHGIYVYEKCCC